VQSVKCEVGARSATHSHPTSETYRHSRRRLTAPRVQTTAPCRRPISFSAPVRSHSRLRNSVERFHSQMKRGKGPASCAGPQTDFGRRLPAVCAARPERHLDRTRPRIGRNRSSALPETLSRRSRAAAIAIRSARRAEHRGIHRQSPRAIGIGARGLVVVDIEVVPRPPIKRLGRDASDRRRR
jgi:hypothetical protein